MTARTPFRALCILILIALLGAACSKKVDLKEEIVGQWEGQFQGAVTQIEFTAEGMLVITATVENISTMGIYLFSEEDVIRMTLPELGLEDTPGEIKIQGDKLTIHDPLGEISGEFTRLKK